MVKDREGKGQCGRGRKGCDLGEWYQGSRNEFDDVAGEVLGMGNSGEGEGREGSMY